MGVSDDRSAMIQKQLRARGIQDERLLDVMSHIPRERFMPAAIRHMAYEDRALPIGSGQTISQPFIVALMTEALELSPESRVLEIGTGSGYQTAILSALAGEVYTIERHEELTRLARQVIAELELENVHFLVGDGTLGFPEAAPYDAIMVTATGPRMPQPLWEQLAEGGRLVMPIGEEDRQLLQVIQKIEGRAHTETLSACRFVPLVGVEGWSEDQAPDG
jgi:protein-L-isoaspartate(D-aspartate) O-methyltransferase